MSRLLILTMTFVFGGVIQSHAQTLTVNSAQKLFYSQNTALARGTNEALKISKKTGRAVVMAFPTTADRNGNMAAVVINAPENASHDNDESGKSQSRVDVQPVTGITFDALFGSEWAPKYDDDVKRNPIVNQRVAIKMLNSRAEAYAGMDFGAEEGDRLRYGGRVLLARPDFYDYGAADFYVYSEASPGNPNKDHLVTNTPTNIDMRYSAGLGLRWTNDEGFGVVFEGGIAYFSKTQTQTNDRGHRLAIGVVKSWGGNNR